MWDLLLYEKWDKLNLNKGSTTSTLGNSLPAYHSNAHSITLTALVKEKHTLDQHTGMKMQAFLLSEVLTEQR